MAQDVALSKRKDYFPFFELPAELRVNIYELLLTYDGTTTPKRCAETAILETSKQVYKETRGILYNQSKLLVDLEIRQPLSHTRYDNTDWLFSGDVEESFYTTNNPRERMQKQLPGILARAKDVTLRVTLDYSGDRYFNRLNEAPQNSLDIVYLLATYLQTMPSESHTIRVQVRLLQPHGRTPMRNDDWYYPLLRLPQDAKVEFIGFEEGEQEHVDALRKNAAHMSTLDFDRYEEFEDLQAAIRHLQSTVRADLFTRGSAVTDLWEMIKARVNGTSPHGSEADKCLAVDMRALKKRVQDAYEHSLF